MEKSRIPLLPVACLSLLLAAIAIAKWVTSGFVPPAHGGADAPLGFLQSPWIWNGVIVAELVAAIALMGIRSRMVAGIIAVALAGAVVFHGIDVVQRGGHAEGCGCFASPGLTSAGLDLVRTSLVFGLFAIGATWPRPTSVKAAGLFVAMVLAFVGTWFVEMGGASSVTLPAAPHVPEVEAEDDAPVLLTRPETQPPPSAKLPMKEENTLNVLVRSAADSEPIEGAVVTVVSEDGSPAVKGATLADGTVELRLEATTPVAIRVDGPAPFRSTVEQLGQISDIEIPVELTRGVPLEIRTVDLDGQTIPDVPVIVSVAGDPVDRETPIAKPTSDPVPIDSRHFETNGLGVVLIPDLDPDRSYEIRAKGWGRPLQDGATDVSVPGHGKVHTLRLAPRRTVWARAVDDESGAVVATAFWRPDRSGQPTPPNPNLVRARHFSVRNFLDSEERSQTGDHWDFFLLAGESNNTSVGPMRVVAPGYEARANLYLEARADPEVKQGPILVRMTRIGGPMATLQIELSSSQSVRTMLAVNRGSKRVFSKLIGGGSQEVRIPLPSGDYSIHVGSSRAKEVSIGAEPRVYFVRIALDSLPSLRIVLSSGAGKPKYNGRASVMVSTKGMRAVFTDVLFAEGRSPRFIVPPQVVAIAVSTPDGKLTPPRKVTIRKGKHVKATLELLDAAKVQEQWGPK